MLLLNMNYYSSFQNTLKRTIGINKSEADTVINRTLSTLNLNKTKYFGIWVDIRKIPSVEENIEELSRYSLTQELLVKQ